MQRGGPSAEPTSAEFAGALARELRSPLSTVAGYLDLLVNGGVGEITDAQRDFLGVVSRNVQRLTMVVDDWLDLARLEAGTVALVRQPVDLGAIAARACEDISDAAGGKQQQLAIDFPVETMHALGDARSLYRVVSNLLSNAHKYTQPGGTISLTLDLDGEDTVRLAVADSGIGIHEEDQPMLFRKFFRAPLTESEPGTGLGLPLTRLLVERLGGTISVESALGRGATFTVRLPRAASAAAASAMTTDHAPARHAEPRLTAARH
jgi:signal transduction histidine kinase